jgi:protein-L-isoaspartate(D-aspartate) O-methyltransferase
MHNLSIIDFTVESNIQKSLFLIYETKSYLLLGIFFFCKKPKYSGGLMEFVKLQEALAAQSRASYKKSNPLSEVVVNAFFATPRHLFVKRFRNFGDDKWYEFNEGNANEFLPVVYQDQPLVIWGSDAEFNSMNGQNQISTISQPSFVLRMLDLLDLKEGHTVFELGTASGWNAALISHIIGKSGKVVTSEIITDLASQAVQRFNQFEFKNIKVLLGDGADGDPSELFDRVIFTAGAYDFPAALFEQTKIGGLALFVLKNKGGADNLYLLKKHKAYFEAIYSQPCGFVPVTGKTHIVEMEQKNLSTFLGNKNISINPIDESVFWWGSGNKEYFMWQTSSLRGFLSLFENFEAFQLPDGSVAFGWYDRVTNSLAIAKAGELITYGSTAARVALIEQLKSWVELGMPCLGNLNLRIYQSNGIVDCEEASWVSRRPQSTFVWSMPAPIL